MVLKKDLIFFNIITKYYGNKQPKSYKRHKTLSDEVTSTSK